MKLAIVIPYFNYTFFEATLDSLAGQTDNRFNVYIGNDCSPEDPKPLLEKYKKVLQFQYVAFENNLGGKSLVKQWERCIVEVKNEDWIVILGDDDVLSKNYIEEFYKNLEEIEKQQINVIRFATRVINEKDEIITDVYTHPKIESSIDFLFRKLKGGTRSSLSEYVFRKKDIFSVGFKDFPLAWHSDELAVLEFSEFKSIYTIINSIVSVRLSSINISGKRDDMKIKNVSTFNYYLYLLQRKASFFENDQKELLYSRLEKSFMNDKKNIYFWKKLTTLYFSKFQVKRYVLLVFHSLVKVIFKTTR